MDFSAWSPSHLIVAALASATIIGQAIAVLARLKTNTEQLQKQGETFVHAMERLEDRIDKRFEEVNQRFTKVNQQFTGMNQRLRRICKRRSVTLEVKCDNSTRTTSTTCPTTKDKSPKAGTHPHASLVAKLQKMEI